MVPAVMGLLDKPSVNAATATTGSKMYSPVGQQAGAQFMIGGRSGFTIFTRTFQDPLMCVQTFRYSISK